MTDEAKKPLVLAAISLFLIVYYFAAPLRLHSEFALQPDWALLLDDATVSATESPEPRGFALGGSYGHASSDGRLLRVEKAAFHAAVSDEASIAYDRSAAPLVAYDTSGQRVFELQTPGWPWLKSGRLFVVAPEMDSVSEYSMDGTLLWSWDFPATISAFDADGELAVAGLVDGMIVAIGKDGKPVFQVAPGGSRVEVIFGVAVDSKRGRVAAICGVDRQRFVLLEKTGEAYRVASHSYLNTDFRRPVSIDLSADGLWAYYEGVDSIVARSLEGGEEYLIDLPSRGFTLSEDGRRGLAYIVSERTGSRTLACLSPPDRLLASYELPGADGFARAYGDEVFIGSGSYLAAFAARED